VKLDEWSSGKASRDDSASPSSGDDKAALGISVEPLTADLAQRAGVPRGTRGILVDDVNPDAGASDAVLQRADVIEEVIRQPVTTVDELRAAVKKSAERPVLLLVNHQG